MSAAARLLPADGEIVVGERYRVDREIIHELPFDPADVFRHGRLTPL
jgi:type IV secretion system protein VirD4